MRIGIGEVIYIAGSGRFVMASFDNLGFSVMRLRFSLVECSSVEISCGRGIGSVRLRHLMCR